jgi:hypothetical protein
MDSDQFISRNFEDALSITALCSDLGISNDDARLFVYIHIKSSGHPSGIQRFFEEKEEEILALEIMLGKKDLSIISSGSPSESECNENLRKFGSLMKDSLDALDNFARHECGHEFHFRSELARRLRFHTDEEFRKEKLRIFSTLILPQMKKYGKEKALAAFERKRKSSPVLILNFRDSLN